MTQDSVSRGWEEVSRVAAVGGAFDSSSRSTSTDFLPRVLRPLCSQSSFSSLTSIAVSAFSSLTSIAVSDASVSVSVSVSAGADTSVMFGSATAGAASAGAASAGAASVGGSTTAKTFEIERRLLLGVLPPALLAGGVAAAARRASLGFTALKGVVAAWYVSHAALNVCSAPASVTAVAATGWGVHAWASRAARMGPGAATGVPAASVHGLGQDAASTALASALA